MISKISRINPFAAIRKLLHINFGLDFEGIERTFFADCAQLVMLGTFFCKTVNGGSLRV